MKINKLGVVALRSTVLIVTAGASVALSIAPASAETSIGSCSAGDGYYANYSVAYHNSGAYDYIDRYNWYIGKGGSHNNVEARTKADKNFGRSDPTYHTWISGDDIRAGNGSHPVSGVKVPASEKMYVEFKFVFDRPRLGDPRCDGHTRNV